MDKISFGIGCYRFLSDMNSENFNAKNYLNQLADLFHSLSNVSDVKFCDHGRGKLHYTLYEALPRQAELESGKSKTCIFPSMNNFDIRFDVFIPSRFQRELLWDRDKEIMTELFRVYINGTLWVPVTFVVPIEPRCNRRPSNSVVIVREFLSKEIRKLENEYISFNALGPSPFHADFHIICDQSSPQNENTLNVDWVPQSGYDEVLFKFEGSMPTESPEETAELIFDEFKDEIGLFYDTALTRDRSFQEWGLIESSFNDLVDIQNTKGIRGFLKKLFCSRQLNSAYVSIAEYDSDYSRLGMVYKKKVENYYSGIQMECFRNSIEQEISDLPVFPTNERIRVLEFLEGRRISSIQALTLLAAAIVGGAVGVLITLLVR